MLEQEREVRSVGTGMLEQEREVRSVGTGGDRDESRMTSDCWG